MIQIPAPEGKKVQKIVYKDKPKCLKCGKPTTSHRIRRKDFSVVWACHGCYSNASDEELEQWRSETVGKDSGNSGEEKKQEMPEQELEGVPPGQEPDADSG